jgi:nicotinamide mononucleotide transporter
MRIKMFPPQYILYWSLSLYSNLSVWYARSENILVYPTGLIATVITV